MPRNHKAFYVGEYGEERDRVWATIKEYLARLSALGSALPPREDAPPTDLLRCGALQIERLDDSRRRRVLHELRKRIESAAFIVADITPQSAKVGEKLRIAWNPNVFFELGMADWQGVPVFMFCDQTLEDALRRELDGSQAHLDPASEVSNWRLPFDIRVDNVHFYDCKNEFAGGASDRPYEDLSNWLRQEERNIVAHLRVIPAIRNLRRALRIVGANDPTRPSNIYGHYKLFEAFVEQLLVDTKNLSQRINYGSKIASVRLESSRVHVLGRMFRTAVDELQSGDEYWTASTLQFWHSMRSLKPEPRFLEANHSAALRGVSVRRLFLVNSQLAHDDEELLHEHLTATLRTEGRYEVRVLASDAKAAAGAGKRAHSGIFVSGRTGRMIGMKPEYTKGNRPQLCGVEIHDEPLLLMNQVQELWEKGTPLKEFLKQ